MFFIPNQLCLLVGQNVEIFLMNLYDHAVQVCQVHPQQSDLNKLIQLIAHEQYNNLQVHFWPIYHIDWMQHLGRLLRP